MSKRVVVPVAKGFEELEAIAIIDILRRADIQVVVAGVGQAEVCSAHGVTLKADCLMSEVVAERIDMVVLPGGWDGTHVLAKDMHVQSLLQRMHNMNKHIGAICAAPYALHTAGVLGSTYTCYPSVEVEINKEGYRDDKAVVIDGNIMTSRGPGTAVCFGLAIVKELVGQEVAESIKKAMLLSYCEI